MKCIFCQADTDMDFCPSCQEKRQTDIAIYLLALNFSQAKITINKENLWE